MFDSPKHSFDTTCLRQNYVDAEFIMQINTELINIGVYYQSKEAADQCKSVQ